MIYLIKPRFCIVSQPFVVCGPLFRRTLFPGHEIATDRWLSCRGTFQTISLVCVNLGNLENQRCIKYNLSKLPNYGFRHTCSISQRTQGDFLTQGVPPLMHGYLGNPLSVGNPAITKGKVGHSCCRQRPRGFNLRYGILPAEIIEFFENRIEFFNCYI